MSKPSWVVNVATESCDHHVFVFEYAVTLADVIRYFRKEGLFHEEFEAFPEDDGLLRVEIAACTPIKNEE